MDFKKMILGREATEDEAQFIEDIQKQLDEKGFTLMGILPVPRPKQ